MGTNLIDIEAILDVAAETLTPFCGLGEGGKLTPSDLEWEAWSQSWGSTALGYSGVGGQAITRAQTVIVYCYYCREVAVFFGGRHLAYLAHWDSPSFAQARERRNLPPVCRSGLMRRS